MKKIYQIMPSSDAPKLVVSEGHVYSGPCREMKGDSIADLVPDEYIKGEVEFYNDWRQVYNIAPGGFVMSQELYVNAEGMYYVIVENELVWVETSHGGLSIVNCQVFAKPSPEPSLFCDMTYEYTIFRVEGMPATNLYCLAGTSIPGNEFKYNYDKYGFKGLEFAEVWRES